MKAQLRRANALGARVCLILGDREVNEGVVELQGPRGAGAGEGRARRRRGARGGGRREPRAGGGPKKARGRGAGRSRFSCSGLFVLDHGDPRRCARRTAAAADRGGPTQTRPTRNKPVGPQRGPGGDDDDQQGPSSVRPPRRRAHGADAARSARDPRSGQRQDRHRLRRRSAGRRGQARIAAFFPLYERAPWRLPPSASSRRSISSTPAGSIRRPDATTPNTDRESLTGLLFYQRRSPKLDADILFPAIWRVRDRENHVFVLGPLAHREAPLGARQLARAALFEGNRKDGGYFHSPPLDHVRIGSRRAPSRSLVPYFRDRTRRDVDWGIAPFLFRGDNGNLDGARKTYTLIPPALFFHRERELDESSLTVVGPVISESNAKRSIFDVAPFFFSIKGKPESGGVRESHSRSSPLPLRHEPGAEPLRHPRLPPLASRPRRTR